MADELKRSGLDLTVVEREIDEFVSRTNLPRFEAAAAVLRSHGLRITDLEPTRPLTDEEKRRLGIEPSLLDCVDRFDVAQSSPKASR